MTLRFIDKYEIVSTLGRGSMGVVYKAKDPEIGRLVAIKTLKSVFMGDDAAGNEALQRFRQESRSAGKLHHPNIVTIFEAGRTENGSPYIVMEYIEGKSLEAMLAESGPIDPLAVLHYLAQIASAIDYAHSQSVIHRDIKPSNIIVDARHRPYLLDFGVAKLSDTSLTPAGTVVGTPSYMSPEQIRGSQLDGRTDLFSLAVVTFEAFTGQRPFPGTDFTTVVSNIIHKEPLSLAEVGSNLPGELEGVLRKGLAKEREERYGSALELVDSAAKAFGVVIDGTGLAGGYTPGLKIPDAAARESANRTRAATVVGSFYPPGGDAASAAASSPAGAPSSTTAPSSSGAGLGSGASAAPTPAVDPEMSETIADHSQLEDVTTVVPRPGYTNGTSPKESTPFSKTSESYPSSSGSAAQKKSSSKLGIAITLLALVAGAGVLAVYRPDLLETFGVHLGSDDEDEEDESGEEVAANDDHSTPDVPSVPAATPTATPTPLPATPTPSKWSRPAAPAAGFTESSVGALSDAEVGWLLTPENTNVDSYRLAIVEAGKRQNRDLSLLLVAAAKNPDFKLRVDVLKILSRAPFHYKQPEVVQAIRDALRDSEFIVRGFAVKSLASVQGAASLDALEGLVKEEKNSVVLKVLNDTISQLKNGAASSR